MNKYLVMLSFCVVTQRTYSKSLYDYMENKKFDLDAPDVASYSNFKPSTEVFTSPHLRYKHQARGRGHGKGHGRRKHELPPHAFDLSDGYDFPDSSEEYSAEIYHSNHFDHPHGLPPGHGREHGPPHGHPHGPQHGHPHGPPQGHPHGPPHGHPHDHPYVIPPRFPPPPVYHKDFLNPWTLSATTPKPFVVQLPPLTTRRPFVVQQPAVYVSPSTRPFVVQQPAVYVSPSLTTRITTTTRAPPSSSTTDDDQLMYDIDVRFGRE